jgi:hypothetical protein
MLAASGAGLRKRREIVSYLANVPEEALFSAGGRFPSHQLGTNPIDFPKPSIGFLYRRIGQKSDV